MSEQWSDLRAAVEELRAMWWVPDDTTARDELERGIDALIAAVQEECAVACMEVSDSSHMASEDLYGWSCGTTSAAVAVRSIDFKDK